MCTNLVSSVDLSTSSEDILDVKFDGKIYFFADCLLIKIIAFMKPRIAENCDICFGFWDITFPVL